MIQIVVAGGLSEMREAEASMAEDKASRLWGSTARR